MIHWRASQRGSDSFFGVFPLLGNRQLLHQLVTVFPILGGAPGIVDPSLGEEKLHELRYCVFALVDALLQALLNALLDTLADALLNAVIFDSLQHIAHIVRTSLHVVVVYLFKTVVAGHDAQQLERLLHVRKVHGRRAIIAALALLDKVIRNNSEIALEQVDLLPRQVRDFK